MQALIFFPRFAHIGVKQTSFKNDGTAVCFCHKVTNASLIVFYTFREGKTVNKRRKWQAPPREVQAVVHEKLNSENDTDI